MKRLYRHGLTEDFASHSHHVLMQLMLLFRSQRLPGGHAGLHGAPAAAVLGPLSRRREPDATTTALAIRELVLRYARGVDSRDLAAGGRVLRARRRRIAGRSRWAPLPTRWRRCRLRWRATRRRATPSPATPSKRRATPREHRRLHGPPLAAAGGCRVVGVRYRDELARGPDGWRITRRDVEPCGPRDEEDGR